jgi:hypothetical protein
MSDNLVKRLRATPLYEGHGEESELPDEAADEIERLREALKEIEWQNAPGSEWCRDRARAALKQSELKP